MKSIELAKSIVDQHNLKHFHRMNEIDFPISIYLEDGGIDIRIFDLPRLMSNKLISDFFQNYGEVMNIRMEVYTKNSLEGLSSGVRVVRIKPKQNLELKSFVTIGGEMTQVSYRGMTPTCKHCNQKYHSGKSCSEAKKLEQQTTQTTQTAQKSETSTSSQNTGEKIQELRDSQNLEPSPSTQDKLQIPATKITARKSKQKGIRKTVSNENLLAIDGYENVYMSRPNITPPLSPKRLRSSDSISNKNLQINDENGSTKQ